MDTNHRAPEGPYALPAPDGLTSDGLAVDGLAVDGLVPEGLSADRLTTDGHRVLTLRQLRERGLTPAAVAERCRPGGPWRRLLPRVYLLHPGPPSGRERMAAALLYAGRDPDAPGPLGGGREAVLTGPAALALYGFGSVPPPAGLPRIDVLVSRQRRLRDTGGVAVHRAHVLPRPREVGGLPCAPVERAVADAVAGLDGGADDTETAQRLVTEAVRGGYCDAEAVLRELADARLPERPHVAAAVGALIRAGRTTAEERLYAMVRGHRLPEPVWNVDLRLPGGPRLGAVDAYWPEHAVAVVIDPRGRGYGPRADDEEVRARSDRQRERLEALGIALVTLTQAALRGGLERQAAVVRTALVDAADRTPAAYLVVTPR